MMQPLTRNITPMSFLPRMTFALALLIPFTAIGETRTLSCQTTLTKIEHTRRILLPLKHEQEQIQEHVRTIYQELFACQTGTVFSLAQQQHCTQLQEEAPKQFQAMVKSITLTHQTSQQLFHQTHQAQLACPPNSDNLLAKKSSMTLLQTFTISN
jgi:hypothetical protein